MHESLKPQEIYTVTRYENVIFESSDYLEALSEFEEICKVDTADIYLDMWKKKDYEKYVKSGRNEGTYEPIETMKKRLIIR